MEKMIRTVNCGSLNAGDEGKRVVLNGWVHRSRDHGGIRFINLRDRYGITQVVVDEDALQELKDQAETLKFEYCIALEGLVRRRPETMVNRDMTTGEIEVVAQKIQVLSRCDTLPFMIDHESDSSEAHRLRYRYLDMRSGGMQERMILRSRVSRAVRDYLYDQNFLEVETPTLIKSTPEGARDFLVPSRLHGGHFFALPQSPQLFKQALMMGGLDRYFQLARCYRDEDPRGDRQLEFTQIDLEMAFVSKEEVFALVEGMMKAVVQEARGIDLPTPFKRVTYEEAMDRYGSDKPDTRFDLCLQDFSPFVGNSDFGVFKSVLEGGGAVKALVVPGVGKDYSRKKITDLEETAKTHGAEGMAWMRFTAEGLEGGVAKFFVSQRDRIAEGLGAEEGDLLLLVAAGWKTACTALGAVRAKLGQELKLAHEDALEFLWVIDFPLFEYNEEEKRWEAAHHMFSRPQESSLSILESDPAAVKGELYDLVLNGYELASGSIRIHDPALQQRIFDIVGFSRELAEESFGFLLEALRYGPPPHGGIAAGLDRLVMILARQKTLREVISFPKTTAGTSPLDRSPSRVDEGQLEELSLKILSPPREA